MPQTETIAEMFVDIGSQHATDDVAPTIAAGFDSVKELVASAPAPRRPNRTGPRSSDSELAEELSAWSRVSAEASEQHGWE